MCCPVSIPKRKNRVVCMIFRLMNFQVCSSVSSVNILKQIRCNKGMIKSSIKNCLLFFRSSLNINFTKLIFPNILCSNFHFIEASFFNFRIEIFLSSFNANCWYPYSYKYFFIFFSTELYISFNIITLSWLHSFI